MKLYGFPGTRANRVRWMLEEVGAPYEYVFIDAPKREHKTEAHLARHPHGSLPVLEDGDTRIIESCAAVLYLADKFPERGLAPPVDSPARGLYYQWTFYATATLDDPMIKLYFHTLLFPLERRKPEVVEQQRPIWDTASKFLDESLAGKSYLLGEEFSAADVAMGYPLHFAGELGLFDGRPNVARYYERISARDAFKRGFAR